MNSTDNTSPMRIWRGPLIATATFLITQAVTALLIGLAHYYFVVRPSGEASGDLPSSTLPTIWLSFAILISGVISVAMLSKMRLIQWSTAFCTSKIEWQSITYSLAGAFTGIFAISCAIDMIDVPDRMRDVFDNMSDYPFGLINIAILGPLTEELVFREAVQGSMLRQGAKPWQTVVVSALIFGIIHLNWTQTLAGVGIGALLAIIYCKTGSVVMTSIIHILNNTVSVAQMALYGDEAEMPSAADLLGGHGIAATTAAACMAVSLWCMRRLWMHKTRR